MNTVKILLIAAVLIVVGMIAWWLLKVLLGFVLYLILGALVVGGAWFLYSRLTGGTGSRRVRR